MYLFECLDLGRYAFDFIIVLRFSVKQKLAHILSIPKTR